VLMLVTFLLGLVPMLIVHRATRWTLRRRLDSANRALTETAVLPSTIRDVPPPGATPFAPPPGVA
jgi:lipopolysaccharide assembly protein A